MFWKRKDSADKNPDPGSETLTEQVRAHLPGADTETLRIVTAIAGLLGAVAYADRDFSAAEAAHVQEELGRVQGLTPAGAEAICAVLRAQALALSTTLTPRFTRTLLELADRNLRLEVLQLLVNLAAADGTISLDENNQLRVMTKGLGLTQQDYNAAQARHRDKLSSLK